MKKSVVTFLIIVTVVVSLSVFPTDVTEAQSEGPIETIETSDGTSVQQLAWDGSELWYVGLGSDITLQEVNPSNGTTTTTVNLNEKQANSGLNGLAASNESVWVLNSRDPEMQGEIYRINSSSSLTENTIQVPATDPHGLAYDGDDFWTFNSENDTLQMFDTNSGERLQTIELPSTALGSGTDLTWGSGFLWATDGDEIVQIDVSGGVANVVNEHSISETIVQGLTWDGEFFWVGGTDTINRVDIGQIGQPNTPPNVSLEYSPRSPATEQNVTFNASSSNDSNGYIQSYAWDFTGDGVADARGEQVNYTFSRADNYTVRLNVTDNAGYSNSTTKNLTVSEQTPTSQPTSTSAQTTTTATTQVTNASASGQSDESASTPTNGESSGQSSAFGPGFSVGGAVVALLIAVWVGVRKMV